MSNRDSYGGQRDGTEDDQPPVPAASAAHLRVGVRTGWLHDAPGSI